MSPKRFILLTCLFLAINIGLFIYTSPFIALYGPFPNVKSAVVGAVATSRHHDLLKYFFSQEEIDQFTNSGLGVVSGLKEKLFNFNIGSNSGTMSLTEINGSRFKGFLLEIHDPTRIKAGIAESLGEKGQTTSEIARQYGAVAAVNAGGFDDPNGTGTGRTPTGVIIHNGYVMSGSELQGKIEMVGFNKKGQLIVGKYTLKEMKNMGIQEGVSFGPTLIMNGQKQITDGDGGWGIAPRTAIGQKKDGSVLLLVIDGRQPQYSIGATLLDVQNILYDNGAVVAANLDGGSSTTLYFEGKVYNRPCDILGERDIPTAFIVK